MFKFGLKNLRRFKEISPVELPRITVLVGRNSSGKSSFLRVFPLLRQSLMTRTSSPILWWGDLVDFGSFAGTVSSENSDGGISFMFGIDEIDARIRNYYPPQIRTKIKNADVEIRIVEICQKTRIDYFKINIDDDKYRFEGFIDLNGNVSKIILNDINVSNLYGGSKIFVNQGSIFPDILVRTADRIDKENNIFPNYDFPVLKSVSDLLTPHLDKRMGTAQLNRLYYELLLLDSFDNVHLHALGEAMHVKSFQKLIYDICDKDSKKLRDSLDQRFHANRFPFIAQAVFARLRQKLINTLYIGPVRARSERYYRYQDLAVSEIDPDGKNLPMFLNALSSNQLSNFSRWVQSRFGYGVELSRSQGHISINLDVGSTTSNIVDNGYGISQVLPVLAQIWWASNRTSRTGAREVREGPPLLLIEQPELHLHPAHQSLIADALASIPGDRPGKTEIVQFVIETHSEAFVNRLGELITLEKISPSDVQILIFEPDNQENKRSTNVSVAIFAPDGTLVNWPYGVFQPDTLQ